MGKELLRNMEETEPYPSGGIDHSTAMPLEIDEQTAVAADDRLREFAQDADLDISLIVDRSGALVAGIASDANLPVDVISALVAGANGAMRALNSQVGGNGSMESLHFGGNRLIYLREVAERFVLVAVAESTHPAGLIREKALSLDSVLSDLLANVVPKAPPTPGITMRSTRKPIKAEDRESEIYVSSESFPEKASALSSEEVVETHPELTIDTLQQEQIDPPEVNSAQDAADEIPTEIPSEIPTEKNDIPPLPELSAPDEPKEILESLDFGEPEIIVETTFLPIGSGHVTDFPLNRDSDSEESPHPLAATPIPDEEDTSITAFPEDHTPTESHDAIPEMVQPSPPPPTISPEPEASVSEALPPEESISRPIPSVGDVFHEAGVFEIADEDSNEEDEDDEEAWDRAVNEESQPSSVLPTTDPPVIAETLIPATESLLESPKIPIPSPDLIAAVPPILPFVEAAQQKPSPVSVPPLPSPPPLPPQFEIEIDDRLDDTDDPEFPDQSAREEGLIIVTEEDLRSEGIEQAQESAPESKSTLEPEPEPEVRISGPFYF